MTTSHHDTSHLGAALRAARVASGLTQAALADRAGVARATAVQVETGRGRLPTLAACAAALGMAPTIGGREADNLSVGAALAVRRCGLGLAPHQAAALAKIRIQTVSAIEIGGANVLVATVERLAEALGCRLMLTAAQSSSCQSKDME